MAAQVGISGSTKIGNHVIIAGQVGFVGHIDIGDGAFIGAKVGVSKSVQPRQQVTGYPARELMKVRRSDAALQAAADAQETQDASRRGGNAGEEVERQTAGEAVARRYGELITKYDFDTNLPLKSISLQCCPSWPRDLIAAGIRGHWF